jgi:hypothetical protein
MKKDGSVESQRKKIHPLFTHISCDELTRLHLGISICHCLPVGASRPYFFTVHIQTTPLWELSLQLLGSLVVSDICGTTFLYFLLSLRQ